MPEAKPARQKATLLWSTAALVVAADQLTKLWAVGNLAPDRQLRLTGFLQLTYGENTGAVFGLFQGQSSALTVAGLAGLLALFLIYRHWPWDVPAGFAALGLLFGGAVGNLSDRILRGYVVDFLDFHIGELFHWPAFNIADSAITIGVFLLVYYGLSVQRRRKCDHAPGP
ncbi:MAG: signal peptidase II [Chloroflexota bacterium]